MSNFQLDIPFPYAMVCTNWSNPAQLVIVYTQSFGFVESRCIGARGVLPARRADSGSIRLEQGIYYPSLGRNLNDQQYLNDTDERMDGRH